MLVWNSRGVAEYVEPCLHMQLHPYMEDWSAYRNGARFRRDEEEGEDARMVPVSVDFLPQLLELTWPQMLEIEEIE